MSDGPCGEGGVNEPAEQLAEKVPYAPRHDEAAKSMPVEEVRATLATDYHGIYHNGNDHRRPLSNCPRCAAIALLAERDRLAAQVETLRLALEDLHESLFIGSERGLSKETLARMASFAKAAALGLAVPGAETCPECDGRGEVAATPGQPGDGAMPCPSCAVPGAET